MTSNEEIIEMFKQRDAYTDPKIIIKYNNLITEKLMYVVYRYVRKYKNYENYEDLKQEGYIGLFKAVKRFDYRRFPNFFVFCERWINNEIKRSARKYDIVYDPKKRKVIYNELVRNNEIYESPEDTFIRQETILEIHKVLLTLKRDGEIVGKMYGLGDREEQSLRETAQDFNVSHERVRQIKNDILNKLSNCSKLKDLYYQ